MFRRILLLLVLPLSGLAAQAAPLHITITGMNNAQFRVVRSTDSTGRALVGLGTWEITSDSAARATDWLAVVATDSLSRVHVEVSRGGQRIASGEGAFVAVRRDTGAVSLEARGRAPSWFPALKP